ncbi:MAG: hypothetical protein HY275_11830 [Gemmatimonadetes bacterium]|nr:hypothetical protein [Gemmatimonadota bacterium]
MSRTRRTPTQRPLSPRELAELVRLRRPTAGAEAERKAALLERAAATPLVVRRWALLASVHDALLAMRAFPDARTTWEQAAVALGRVPAAVRRLSPAQRAKGDDSGVAGTVTRHTFEFGIARWLADRHGTDVDIDWPALDDTTALDALLRPEIVRAEEDAFDGGLLSTRDWLRLARDGAASAEGESSLRWLLRAAAASSRAAPVVARLYDAAPLPLAWRLGASGAAVTRNTLPVRQPVVRTAFRRLPAHPARAMAAPLDGIERLTGRAARRTIDVTRAALAARCREVFAITNANPEEVWLAPLGDGVELAIIGALPAQRLSLESNYGYLLLSNGIPIGYGGVTPLFHQANTGINIFDPFRGTEAAFLWTAMLRAFHALFGVTRFVINAVQFGEDNEEAIASGAYWFYWRLGFRPVERARRREAQEEARRLAVRGARPSPPTLLRRLATGDMVLTLPGAPARALFDEAWLTTCAALVTRELTRLDPHAHHRAAAQIARDVARRLGVRDARWPAPERDAFRRLAPVVALCDRLDDWSTEERRALAALMRAKGQPQERNFVAQAQAHPRFFPELMARCRAARDVLGG